MLMIMKRMIIIVIRDQVIPFKGRNPFQYIRELKQLRQRRQQERHKFAYLTMKNNSFARFARTFFILKLFADVLVLSTT